MASDDTSKHQFIDQQFIGQEFFYHSNLETNVPLIEEILLLVFGYIRDIENRFKLKHIPLDVTTVIKHFYGKKYYISGNGPLQDEFDYAVEILTPIEMLGITHNHNRICSCTSEFAKRNIIAGSQILQINDLFISHDVHNNDYRIMSKIFKEIKEKTPSCIIFRCKKKSIDKGIHFQIDVTFSSDIITEKKNRFPYHKFTKPTLQSIFKKAFNKKDDDEVEIYQVYGNKLKHGVSILVFINMDNEINCFYKHELMENEGVILEQFKEMISKHCMMECKQQIFERRGNRLNCGFSNITEDEFLFDKKTLMSLMYTVKGIDDGRNAWYLVLCDPDKLETFLRELNSPIIHLEEHGNIIASSYGDQMPKSVEDNAFKLYDF